MEEVSGFLIVVVMIYLLIKAGMFFGEISVLQDCRQGKPIVTQDKLYTCVQRELK